jgi:hypothetical protein
MKRLREVAVRMRPMAPKGAGGGGSQELPPGSGPEMEPGTEPHEAPHGASHEVPMPGPEAAATSGPASGAMGGRGFSERDAEAPIPARTPFMPTSRDLAGRAVPDDPADRLPPVPSRRPSVPRRQIWDLDGGPEAAEPPPARTSYPVTPPRSEPRFPPQSEPRYAAQSEPRYAPPAEAAASQPDAADADDMASRARRALAAVEEQMAGRGRVSVPLAGQDSGIPEDGGAKTRVLGFHAPDLATDPISAVAEKSAQDVLFPAGWLVVVDGPGRGAYFAVSDSVSTIGRGTDQAICLNFGDASVSRQNHAAIAYDAEQNRFFLGHGNKSNIVRRNGMPVLSTEEIVHGDVIRVGKTSLRFVALCGPDFTWGHGAGEHGTEADGNAHD